MDWYDGPTLIDALNNLILPKRQKAGDQPLRFQVSNCYKICGIGTVVCGKVESGEFKNIADLVILPNKINTLSITMESHFNSIEKGI